MQWAYIVMAVSSKLTQVLIELHNGANNDSNTRWINYLCQDFSDVLDFRLQVVV